MASLLIVDDDLEGSEPLVLALTRAGHSVRVAANGDAALNALSEGVPDLVILDVRMPRMDGINFVQVMRGYLRWQSLPVVLYTAYPEDARVSAPDLGVLATFKKSATSLADIVSFVNSKSPPLLSTVNNPTPTESAGAQ
jgi:CheY-like chemotaxis protein